MYLLVSWCWVFGYASSLEGLVCMRGEYIVSKEKKCICVIVLGCVVAEKYKC